MRKIIFTFFFVLLLVLVGYLIVNCVVKIDNNFFGISLDKVDGRYRILDRGYNFILKGIIPGRVQIYIYKKKNTCAIPIEIPVPPLDELNEDLYSVKISVNIVYEVDTKLLVTSSSFVNSDKPLYNEMKTQLEGCFNKALYSYFLPRYRREAIYRAKETIIEYVSKNFKKQSQDYGINILNFGVFGNFDLPSNKSYYDGLSFYGDLRKIKEKNKKELLVLKNKLLQEKYKQKQYLDQLSEIAKIIDGKPDIIKYIYINRMAKNVKLIISSDKSGMPFGLGFEEDIDKNRNSEIDNLR